MIIMSHHFRLVRSKGEHFTFCYLPIKTGKEGYDLLTQSRDQLNSIHLSVNCTILQSLYFSLASIQHHFVVTERHGITF